MTVHEHQCRVCGAVFDCSASPPCGWPRGVVCVRCLVPVTAVDWWVKNKYLAASIRYDWAPAQARERRRRNTVEPYNKTGLCPKCGGAMIGTFYHPAGAFNWYDCRGHGGPNEEHLVRLCRECKYEWSEACVPNSAQAPANPAQRTADLKGGTDA